MSKRNNAISIYGRASKIIHQKGYSYAQRKQVSIPAHRAKRGIWLVQIKAKTYLRKTGKIIHVKAHYNITKSRDTRFTFYGTPEDCKQARNKVKQEGLVPRKQFEDQIKATDFLKRSQDYSKHGVWDWDDTKES